jgi:hypothetical protein
MVTNSPETLLFSVASLRMVIIQADDVDLIISSLFSLKFHAIVLNTLIEALSQLREGTDLAFNAWLDIPNRPITSDMYEACVERTIFDIIAGLESRYMSVTGLQSTASTDLNESLLRAIVCECVTLLRLAVSPFADSSGDGRVRLEAMSQDRLGACLCQLLTPAMFHLMMTDTTLFLNVFRCLGSTRRALCIWNKDMMHSLQTFNKSSLSSSSDTEFRHSGDVTKLVVVDGVYIDLLLRHNHRSSSSLNDESSSKEDIGCRDLPLFVELLQSSILSSKRILATKHSNSLKEAYTVKQNVLDQIINDHPELGYQNLFVDDETDIPEVEI